MINPKVSLSLNIMPEMLDYIAKKGLKGCITDGYSREQSIAITLKVSHLLGYLTTITTWDSLTRFIQEFNAHALFREVNFDSFIDEFEQRFGQNIEAYMDEWYTSHQMPWLSIKDLSLKTTEEMRIMDFKVGNFSETDGIVSIITPGITESGKDKIEDWRSYLIKPGECKRIIVHEDIRHSMEITTNFSGNLPKKMISTDREIPLSGPVPDEGITLLCRDQFYPSGEIIVDNEDEGFHLIDSANNRKRLSDLIKKESDEEKYSFFHNLKANTWDLPIISLIADDFYGECIRSGFTKEAGTGKFKAEWVANLPTAGKYEIFIYRPHFYIGEYMSDYPGMKNYYTVYTPEGKEEIILDVEKDDPTWVSLGTFTLPAGESRVILDDRGVPPIEEEGHGGYSRKWIQLVVADAVKWVKTK